MPPKLPTRDRRTPPDTGRAAGVRIPTVIPSPHRHTPPTVIPAQAGIQNPG